MKEKDYDKNNFYVLLFFSFIFIIIYLFYLFLIITYIIKYYHRKKLCVYWIDYCLLNFTGFIFVIIFTSNLIYNLKNINNDEIRIKNPIDLSNNIFSLFLILSLNLMCVTIIVSLLFDSLIAIKLSIKLNKIKKITEKDILVVSEKLKKIKINNILNFKNTIKYYIIFLIVILIYSFLCFLAYTDTNVKRFDSKLTLYNYFAYLLRLFNLIVLVLLIISIIIMNKSKKLLIKREYYNPDRLTQRIYDIHFSYIIYYTDIISFKLVSDLIMNIPPLFFLYLEKYNTISLIFSEIIIFIYIFIGGNQNLILDKDNDAGKISKKLQYWFCFKKLDFHFGEKDHRIIFDEYQFNYSPEEQKLFNDLNLTIIKNIENNLLDIEQNKSITENNTFEHIFDLDSSSVQTLESNINKKDLKILEFKTIAEFYLVQKLLILFFKMNQKIYEPAVDGNTDNFLTFKKLDFERKSKKLNINSSNKEEFISNVNRMSRMSIRNIKKMKTSLKISQNDIFTSIEEKELLEELKNKLKIKNEQFIYKIESIFSAELLELFPFYQMKVNNILKSLNPTRNIKIFEKFIKRRNYNQTNFRISNLNNRLSVKSYKTNDNIDNTNFDKTEYKKELEKNLYYTYDLYLMYEIYDKEEFGGFDELEDIITEYNSYLLSVIKNMSYTFLPLIIGIFNLEIYNSNKILILYKNPLYFTIFNHFNHWINFYITEEPEKIRVSSLFNDVIDVNEIEIRNNLKLNEADYDEVIQTMEKDYSFLKKVKNIFPIIHLFIGDENNEEIVEETVEGNEKNHKMKNHNQYNENSILGELSLNKDIGLVDVLEKNLSISNSNNPDEFNEINNMINESSLFDKEYYYISGKIIRTIKIYFTNLFRKDCQLNKNQDNIFNKINSEEYCEYLQGQLIKYLRTNSLFNNEKNEDNNN